MRTCRPTVGSALSRLVTSPRRHSGRSSTNLSRRLRGPRSGLVGHRRRSRPTSPTAVHNLPKRSHELNAGTAGLEHLTVSIRTADLEKLKFLARREKTMSHTWSSLRTPSSPTRHSCTNASLQPVLPDQDRGPPGNQASTHSHCERQFDSRTTRVPRTHPHRCTSLLTRGPCTQQDSTKEKT